MDELYSFRVAAPTEKLSGWRSLSQNRPDSILSAISQTADMGMYALQNEMEINHEHSLSLLNPDQKTQGYSKAEHYKKSNVVLNSLTKSNRDLAGRNTNIEEYTNPVSILEFVIDWIHTLMPKLDHWCSLSDHNDPPTGLVSLVGLGVLHTADEIPDINDPYIPEYQKSEDQVINELMSITMGLHSSLKGIRSSQNMYNVAGWLKIMRGMLRDIKISRKCLAEVSLRHLQLVEAWSFACGRQEWALHELLDCSTECTSDLEKAGMHLNTASAAFKAAETSKSLASLNTLYKDFYVAMSIHYEAVGDFFTSNTSQKSFKVPPEVMTALEQSSNLFFKDLLPNPSYKWQAKHAVLFTIQVMGISHGVGHITALLTRVLSQTHTSRKDLSQAEFLEELITTLFLVWDEHSSFKTLDDLLSITEEVEHVFHLYKNSRPSRVQPALVRIMKAHAKGLYYKGNYQAATPILEEAIRIQQDLTTSDDIEAAQYLLVLLGDYFGNYFQRDFQFIEIFMPHSLVSFQTQEDNTLTPGTYDSLMNLSHSMQFIQDLHTLDIIHGLLCVVAPLYATDSSMGNGVAILRMLLIIADMQRGLGAFNVAFQSCKKILFITTDNCSRPAEIYFNILTSYSQSLLDKDEYEEASIFLKQAAEIWEKDISLKWDLGSLAHWATMSAMVDAQLSPSDAGTWQTNKAIGKISQCLEESSEPRTLPIWLCSIPGCFDGGYKDILSWLLLIQKITSYKALQLSEMIEESLFHLMVYYDQVSADLEPYAEASIWAQRCILLSLLGKRKAQQQALDKTVEFFHLAFVTQPQKAFLPLLIMLQILHIISGAFVNISPIPFDIQMWKKTVYEGSTAFFDHIIAFLRDLPHHIEVQHSLPLPVDVDVDEVLFKDADEGSELEKDSDSDLENVGENINSSSFTNENGGVIVDLPGKTVHFTKQSMAVSSSGQEISLHYYPTFDLDKVPNLTGRITIVKGPLCAGGFCDIYSGDFKSEQGTEKVAMKMLRVFSTEKHIVKAKKKFRKEVNLWCLLKHPHVLPFYGTCEFDEFRLFMIAPWAEGGNSLEYIRQNPLANRGKLLSQAASALDYLHSGCHAPPIVHGDLKADNVLVSASGDALLCDFGLSVHVEEILSKSGSSSAGRAGGHARFMAPELLLPPEDSGQLSRATRESDVFAFASLMLQIFTEMVPFGDLLEAQAIIKLAQGRLPPRPTDPVVLARGCDDRAWDLMNDCWRFNPLERPGMGEVLMRMTLQDGISS